MPKAGYTAITISVNVYGKIKEMIDYFNRLAGYRKFRSVSHFVEEACMEYLKSNQKQVSNPSKSA